MNKELKPSSDRKTKFWDNQRNTFGLLPGPEGSCPMATVGEGGCRYVAPGRKNPGCYVYNIMSAYGGVRGVLEANTKLLRNSDIKEKTRLLANEFKRFRDAELKRSDPNLFYRIHWSGDVFDNDYALALSQAMNEFPDVTFWMYTRSLPFVKFIANNTPNLILYISLDPCNILPGLQTYFDWALDTPIYKNVNICYMSPVDDFEVRYEQAYFQNELSGILAQYRSSTGAPGISVCHKWPKETPKLRECPADNGTMESTFCCSKCRGCVNKRDKWTPKAVWFKS